MPKDKYEPPCEKRQHRIMQKNEINEGKPNKWNELEIFGKHDNIMIYIYVWVPEKTGRMSPNLKNELVIITNCPIHS